jgi:aspartate racemase
LTSTDELVVGVIGGLGPEATLDFLGKVLVHSNARTDQEHLHLIVEINPKTPNRNAAIAGTGPSPAPMLAGMARALERAGADFIVMACNTAHAFENDVRAATGLPFVSLIEEVVNDVRSRHPDARTVGLLAAQGCLDAKIYQTAFGRHGINVIELGRSQQSEFMALLYQIKGGDLSETVRTKTRALGDALVAQGADILIAACTEIPLVLADGDNPKPMVDSSDVLARRCVAYARRHEELPGTNGVKS